MEAAILVFITLLLWYYGHRTAFHLEQQSRTVTELATAMKSSAENGDRTLSRIQHDVELMAGNIQQMRAHTVPSVLNQL